MDFTGTCPARFSLSLTTTVSMNKGTWSRETEDFVSVAWLIL